MVLAQRRPVKLDKKEEALVTKVKYSVEHKSLFETRQTANRTSPAPDVNPSKWLEAIEPNMNGYLVFKRREQGSFSVWISDGEGTERGGIVWERDEVSATLAGFAKILSLSPLNITGLMLHSTNKFITKWWDKRKLTCNLMWRGWWKEIEE